MFIIQKHRAFLISYLLSLISYLLPLYLLANK